MQMIICGLCGYWADEWDALEDVDDTIPCVGGLDHQWTVE